jgi:hypothetical protein
VIWPSTRPIRSLLSETGEGGRFLGSALRQRLCTTTQQMQTSGDLTQLCLRSVAQLSLGVADQSVNHRGGLAAQPGCLLGDLPQVLNTNLGALL